MLEAREQLLGAEHPDTLTTKSNLAGTLRSLGELPAARALQDDAIRARGQVAAFVVFAAAALVFGMFAGSIPAAPASFVAVDLGTLGGW